MTEVLRYARYMGAESEAVFDYEDFCGSCRQFLGRTFQFPRHPEDVEAECASPHGPSGAAWRDPDTPLIHFAFCPWCGAQFREDWRRQQPIQNERTIDHFSNPGTHRGDTHAFTDSPGGHHISATCWCDPLVEPELMGCTIWHQEGEPPSPPEIQQIASR